MDTTKLQAPEPIPSAEAAPEPDRVVIDGFSEAIGEQYHHTLPLEDHFKAEGPIRINKESLGVLPTAESVAVIDINSTKLLFEKSWQEQRPLASISKLMTTLVLLDLGVDFDEHVIVSQSDYVAGGKLHVFTGEELTKADLWKAGLIASDNVAIMSLVRSSGIEYDEFIGRMNQKSKDLGMMSSSFVEPTGVSIHNVSSAHDIAILLQEAMKRPEIEQTVIHDSETISIINKDNLTRRVFTTNKLIDSFVNEDPYQVIGGKTGYIPEAGYCLAVIIDGPNENDHIAVIALGSDSDTDRFQDVKGLVDWIYQSYQW